jgi:CAI-1 autoinducer synthase
VIGPRGEGLVAALGLSGRVLFRTASLSKAFCARGGIVAGPKRTLKYFRYEARPAIFSSAVLTHEGVALCATLDVIQASQPARLKLKENADWLREGLDTLGYHVGNSQTQILSLQSGEEWRTRILRDALEARGVFGAVFCAPATPRNKSLVRLSLHSAMTADELTRVLQVCAEVRDEVKLSDWASTRRKEVPQPKRLAPAA